jgi:outer membrane protein assembly factor BamD (BamD/ComL family)
MARQFFNAQRWIARLAVLCVLATCQGCHSTFDKLDVSGIMGPTGRAAKRAAQESLAERDAQYAESREELEAARKLFDQQQYAQALREYKKIARKRKGQPAEEDALFMKAECYYALKQYTWAQDAYDELLKKHPSTQHLEHATKRLFAIARFWLGNPKMPAEVELAHFEKTDSAAGLEKKADASVPWTVTFPINLFDRKRPIFDPEGRALQALRAVWMNDPTGPLADDALLLHAVYHLRKKDFRQADDDFAMIRQEFANRELAPAAYVLGSHASMMAYQGAAYDGKQLEEAKNLTESALRLFPELPQRPKLMRDLESLNNELARRDWERAAYHLKRKEKAAAAYYCEAVVENFPDSPYAQKAREALDRLGPQFAAGLLSEPMARKKEPRDGTES